MTLLSRSTESPLSPLASLIEKVREYGPGLFTVLAIAYISQGLASHLPLIGAPVVAIVLGLVLRLIVGFHPSQQPGVNFAAKSVLKLAVMLIGFSMPIAEVWAIGVDSFWVMLATLLIGLAAAFLSGRLLRVPGRLTALIGVGTSICGASAIAAIAPILIATEIEIAYSIATVFLFNFAAMLIFPWVGHALQMSESAFGLWAGTAINDTSSVIAVGYMFGDYAGAYATIVKLARSTMIVPIVIALSAALIRRTGSNSTQLSIGKVFPWFVLGFLLLSVASGFLPGQISDWGAGLGKFFIVVALAGVGYGTELKKMGAVGWRPVLVGMTTWLVLAAGALLVQRALGWM